MLVLARKPTESVTVTCPNGDKVKFLITEIKGLGRVHVGIEAENDYIISRTDNVPKENK